VAALAERQDGVISRGQLRACGVSDTDIARWHRDSRLHRLHPAVYALGHTALGIRGSIFAALLYAGPESALSHQTAAWLWKLIPTRPNRVHVTTPRDRTSIEAIAVHRASVRVVRRDCFPVTSLPRTLLHLAATMPFAGLRRALAEADFLRLLDPSAVTAELGRGRKGSAALRKALTLHLPELASANEGVEEAFLLLCERAGIPIPGVNVYAQGFKVDCLWHAERLIVELDSQLAHGHATAVKRDRHRDLMLRRAAYKVRRYTWNQVVDEPDAVVEDLRAALG
jgi:hypothetical protein